MKVQSRFLCENILYEKRDCIYSLLNNFNLSLPRMLNHSQAF